MFFRELGIPVVCFPLTVPPKVRDWLIRQSEITGKLPSQIAHEVLRAGATKDGFPPKPHEPPHNGQEKVA